MIQLKNTPLQPSTQTKLPSFSIVYETENLSSVELENIYRSLASLKEQDIPLEKAREFTILDSGYAAEEAIAKICSMYPWVTVKSAPEVGYYEAKMLGATLVTGEIIVFCDSDCVYEPNWLRNILASFQQNSEIKAVAGETSTPVRNIYELALAMHYFFPRFSGRKHLYISNHYFLNAVAFHVWRYLLLGRDGVVGKHIKSSLTENQDLTDFHRVMKNLHPWGKIRGICSTILRTKPIQLKKIREVLREDKRRLAVLPIVIPLLLWFELLSVIGSVITYIQPDWLLQRYREKECNPQSKSS